jgi:hypothetical protein
MSRSIFSDVIVDREDGRVVLEEEATEFVRTNCIASEK